MASIFVPHPSILDCDANTSANTTTNTTSTEPEGVAAGAVDFATHPVVVGAGATLTLPSLSLLDPTVFGLPAF